MARGGQHAIEDLGFAPYVELSRWLIEQDEPRTQVHGAERAGQCNALPLSAGEIGAAGVAARQHGVEFGQSGRAGRCEGGTYGIVRRASGRDVVAQWELESDEVLKDGRQP